MHTTLLQALQHPLAPCATSSRAGRQTHPSNRSRSHIIRALDDDGPPAVQGDWRAFRAGLISQTDKEAEAPSGSAITEANISLLRDQNVELAMERVWAHAIERAETGAVLLATLKAPRLLNDARMWQLVILLLEHGPNGTTGVILNRPSSACAGDLLDKTSKFAKDSHQEMRAFGHGALYLGGMFPSNKLFTQPLVSMHHNKVLASVSTEIVPGFYLGGQSLGAERVEAGEIASDSFRFFAGLMRWGPGQLNLEVDSGIWHLVACSRNLVAKHCLGLPVPLWLEIMDLVGGEHRKSADQARKQQF